MSDLSHAQLTSVAATLDGLTSAHTGNGSTEGLWKRIAEALEQGAGVSNPRNDNLSGYMERAALAAEAAWGGSGTDENQNEAGFLKRIADAMELQAGAVSAGSLAQRVVTACSLVAFGVPWTPTTLGASVKLWLDAQTNVTQAAGAVSAWGDRSASALSFAQATAGNKPTYSATGFSASLPGISFATDDFVEQTTNFPPLATPFSIFAVYKDYSAGFILADFNGTAAQLYRNAFNIFADGAYGGALQTGSHFLGANFNGASSSVRVDSIDVTALATGNNLALGATTPLRVGQSGGAGFLTGTLAEIIVVSGALTATVREKMEGYVAHRWGLTANLPSTHRYKVNGPKT